MYVIYYVPMLQCWQLVRILVKTNHPCLMVGCHKSLPLLSNGFVCELLKARDLISEGIGLAQWKELGEKCIGALLIGGHNFLVGVEPLL
jgi:hypothetical protein